MAAEIPRIIAAHPIASGVVAAIAIGYAWSLFTRKPIAETVASATAGAVSAASDVAGGVAQGLMAAVGVPTTGQSKCCTAIKNYSLANGWFEQVKASFVVSAHCPMPDYLRWAAGKGRPSYCVK